MDEQHHGVRRSSKQQRYDGNQLLLRDVVVLVVRDPSLLDPLQHAVGSRHGRLLPSKERPAGRAADLGAGHEPFGLWSELKNLIEY